jgi:hypothetical protein
MPFESSVDLEYASNLVLEITNEVKRAGNKDHTSCCSSWLVFVLRSISNVPDALSVASVCADAVTEWSTKRTQLGAICFDELFVHMPR